MFYTITTTTTATLTMPNIKVSFLSEQILCTDLPQTKNVRSGKPGPSTKFGKENA